MAGSGAVIPIEHKETLFELTEEEVVDTFDLLKKAKKYIDEKYSPDGYNI